MKKILIRNKLFRALAFSIYLNTAFGLFTFVLAAMVNGFSAAVDKIGNVLFILGPAIVLATVILWVGLILFDNKVHE